MIYSEVWPLCLKLDHDAHNSRRLSLWELVRRAERANVTIQALWQRRSASGRGWHRLVRVEPFPTTAVGVVALQLLFGSDPLREAYCYNRARRVDARTVPLYWRMLDAWDVLYDSADEWRYIDAKLLAAHRERNGKRAPHTARDIKKGVQSHG